MKRRRFLQVLGVGVLILTLPVLVMALADRIVTIRPGYRRSIQLPDGSGKFRQEPSVTMAPGERIIVQPEGWAAPTPTPVPTPTPAPAGGVWLSPAQLAALPMSGAAWDSLPTSVAGSGNVSDQDSTHDVLTLGLALRAARSGNAAQRTAATTAIQSAIGTESGSRWLAIGRNLGAYVIAADVLDIRSGPIFDWLKSFLTRTLAHNNTGAPITLRQNAWGSGSNADAQTGFVHAALAVYAGTQADRDWGWTAFRRYCGDRTSTHTMTSNSDSWQQIPADPVGIQNLGAVKNGARLDGAISNDMSRGGEFSATPGYTSYPWVGLEGAVPAALVFARAGYPAWTVVDSALRRAAEYLYFLRTQNVEWYDDDRAPEIKHLLNIAYGLSLPGDKPTRNGRTVGYTDFTHPFTVAN